MSISAIERQNTVKTGFAYLMLSILCALIGAVYEIFSHGVYSFYMIYAFGFPLVLGAFPFYALHLAHRRMPGQTARHLYHCGVATWTVGSFMEGALEIYGTANHLTAVYWIAGAFLLLAGLGLSRTKRTK